MRCRYCLANMQASQTAVLPGCILTITWKVHHLLLGLKIYLLPVMFCLYEDGPSLPIPVWLAEPRLPGDYDLFLSQISILLGQRINTKHITNGGDQIAPKGVKINQQFETKV